MWKRILPLALAVMMLFTLTAQAADPRYSSNRPSLYIDDDIATCEVTYTAEDSSDSVKIILTLWCGENIVDSWTKTGTGRVTMSKTCEIVPGNTYDLVMMPVVNGKALEPVTVSADS